MLAPRYDQIEEIPQPHARENRIFKAFDNQEKRWVFIKMLIGAPHNARLDQKLRQRFEREIVIALKLEHNYILKASDRGYEPQMSGEAPLPYLVYPYMQSNLRDLLSSGTPPWDEWSLIQIADLILQAADALFYMHTLNPPLVHWDVKITNFLVDPVRQPSRIAHLFLCDFGISRGYDEQTSNVHGTLSHMPPEQWDRNVRCESDQYALAIVACYLLTKQLPLDASHQDDSKEWYRLHHSEKPMPPSQLNPQRIRPGDIDIVILKALNKDYSQRFPTIQIFAKELYNAIKKQSPAYADTVYVDNHSLSVTVPVEPKFDPVPLHPPIDTEAYHIIDVPPPPMLRQPVAPAKDIWSSLPVFSSKLLLEHRLPAPLHTICWSPDGNYLACLFLTHPPLILDRSGKERSGLSLPLGHVACWAPRGYVLAISSQHILQGQELSKIEVINWQAPVSPLLTLTFAVPIIDGLDWSIKGQLAVWPWNMNQIQVYTISNTSPATQSTPMPKTIPTPNMTCGGTGVLCWSPDGSLLAAGGQNGSLMCWRADNHALHRQIPGSSRRVYSLAWSPDSTLLAVAFKDRRIVIWNVYEDRIQAEWKNLPIVPQLLSISRERLLAVSSNKNHLLVGSIDQSRPRAKQPGRSLAVWSPTRNELATLDPQSDAKLVIWQK